MASHKFRVGQMVGLNLSPRDVLTSSVREYKILRLLPHARGECTYRIKTITEASERIATEGELVVHASVPLHSVS